MINDQTYALWRCSSWPLTSELQPNTLYDLSGMSCVQSLNLSSLPTVLLQLESWLLPGSNSPVCPCLVYRNYYLYRKPSVDSKSKTNITIFKNNLGGLGMNWGPSTCWTAAVKLLWLIRICVAVAVCETWLHAHRFNVQRQTDTHTLDVYPHTWVSYED